MSGNIQNQIIDLISRSEKILLLPSSPPDGDSIGASISLYLVLKKLGKQVTVVCSDPIPEVLQFLPNTDVVDNKAAVSSEVIITVDQGKVDADSIRTEIIDNKLNIIITPREGRVFKKDFTFGESDADYDLIITVDTAELVQIRDFYEQNVDLFHKIPVINIDHHVSNAHFGKINYVDIMAASTTELLLPLFEEMADREQKNLIDEDVATLLLTGIITDTGSFQNANTTPRSFSKAAKLISYGARQQEIIQHIYKTKQLSQLKLWGRVLTKIQTDDKYKIIWSVVSQQDFKDTESSVDQTGDVIDELMTNAPEAEVVILMKEKEDGTVSISVRTTTPSVDASKIAEHFSGGGHTQAAGFRIENMDLRDAEFEVINYVREFQKDRLGIIEEGKIEPIIDIEKLISRAQEAQKATEIMPQVEKNAKKQKDKFNPKTPLVDDKPQEEEHTPSPYKFED